jgi:hypothetical protein
VDWLPLVGIGLQLSKDLGGFDGVRRLNRVARAGLLVGGLVPVDVTG